MHGSRKTCYGMEMGPPFRVHFNNATASVCHAVCEGPCSCRVSPMQVIVILFDITCTHFTEHARSFKNEKSESQYNACLVLDLIYPAEIVSR